jgi:hypothetical protein
MTSCCCFLEIRPGCGFEFGLRFRSIFYFIWPIEVVRSCICLFSRKFSVSFALFFIICGFSYGALSGTCILARLLLLLLLCSVFCCCLKLACLFIVLDLTLCIFTVSLEGCVMIGSKAKSLECN